MESCQSETCCHSHEKCDPTPTPTDTETLKNLEKELLKSGVKTDAGKLAKNKHLKKLMQKMQSDPKLKKLIEEFKQNPDLQFIPQKQDNSKDRLRAKLQNKRIQRGGPQLLESMKKRQQKKSQSTQKSEEEKQQEITTSAQNTINSAIEEVKKQKKAKKKRLAKLQHKYGMISFEKYSQALKNLSETSNLLADEIQYFSNLRDLYIKQHPELTIEKQLDLGDDGSESDQEV